MAKLFPLLYWFGLVLALAGILLRFWFGWLAPGLALAVIGLGLILAVRLARAVLPRQTSK